MFNGNANFYSPGKNLDINISGSTNLILKSPFQLNMMMV